MPQSYQIDQSGIPKKNLNWTEKKTRFDLVFLLLNVLHHVQSNGYWYCYFWYGEGEKKVRKCQMCTIPIIFSDFEMDVDNNMFDVDFLNDYYSKVCFQSNQLFEEKKDAVCCFLHQVFAHKGRDWRSGET